MEKVTRRITEGVFGYATLLLFIIAAEFTFYSIVPFQYFVGFDSLTPVRMATTIGEPLRMYSKYSHARSTYDTRWTDTLFCDEGDGYGFVAIGTSNFSANDWRPDDSSMTEQGTQWQYDGKTPDIPAVCYMRATMTIDLKYGISKNKEITSVMFRFTR